MSVGFPVRIKLIFCNAKETNNKFLYPDANHLYE